MTEQLNWTELNLTQRYPTSERNANNSIFLTGAIGFSFSHWVEWTPCKQHMFTDEWCSCCCCLVAKSCLEPTRLPWSCISQSRTLEWVAISFSRRSSWPRDQTHVSSIAGGFFYHWVIWEAQVIQSSVQIHNKQMRKKTGPWLDILVIFGNGL